MSCQSCSSSTSSSNCTVSPIVVYRGRSFAPIIRLINPETCLPIDTTPYTEIEVAVGGILPAPCVSVLFTLTQVVKVSPDSSGQIQPKFTGANTLAFGLTDPTAAAACSFTPITVKLTDPTNPDQDPYILVIANALNILDPPC